MKNMDFRVILRPEITSAPGFSAKRANYDFQGRSLSYMHLPVSDAYSPQLIIFMDAHTTYPPQLPEYVLSVEFEVKIPTKGIKLELGWYEHKTGKAEVSLQLPEPDPERYRTHEVYVISGSANTIEEAREIVTLIKSKALPPTSNYEGPPAKSLREIELEQRVERLETLLEQLRPKEDIPAPSPRPRERGGRY
jgi:hypothetical protein